MKKLALALAGTAFLLLALAGGFVLVTGRAPQSLFRPPPAAVRFHFDEERAKAAASVRGKFRGHVDPRVGYTMRQSTQLDTLKIPFQTDDLGLRARVGPETAPDAQRIVVLGDSVAFGVGVTDAETYPQQLEDALAEAQSGGGPRRVVCLDVAVEGWNWRNSFAFLRDHLDRLRPDVVLFMPIANDLSDVEGTWETGHRRLVPDLENGDPWLYVNLNRLQECLLALQPRVESGELALSGDEIGPIVLNADLGGESSRRFDAMAEGIAALGEELATRGVHFAIVQYEDIPFLHAVERRLARRAAALPWIPLLDKVTSADSLADDPHPNATVNRALARWTAQSLVDVLHWVEAKGAVPAVDAAYAARRAPRRTAEQVEELAAGERDVARQQLVRAIEPPLGRGVQQVYGGVSPANLLGARALVALPRPGDSLEIELAPLPDRPDLLPLAVTIEADGTTLGVVKLERGGADAGDRVVRAKFPLSLPAATRPDGARVETVDVRLVPDRFGACREPGGYDLASCRLVRIARGGG